MTELWSELHLLCLGELMSGIIIDNYLPEDEEEEIRSKLVKLRIIYKQLRDENDEIHLTTGLSRENIRVFRFIEIPTKIN